MYAKAMPKTTTMQKRMNKVPRVVSDVCTVSGNFVLLQGTTMF